MPAIANTSGRLHSEFIRLLFLQAHRETDRFFEASGVQSAQSDRGFCHFRRAVFSSMLKSHVGNILAKATALRINLNLNGAPIASNSHCEKYRGGPAMGPVEVLLRECLTRMRQCDCFRDSGQSALGIVAEHVQASIKRVLQGNWIRDTGLISLDIWRSLLPHCQHLEHRANNW
jgi:hypothetical protein